MTRNHQLMKNTPLIYKCIPNYSNCVLLITLYIYKQDTLCSLFFFFANRSSTGTSSYEAFYHLLSNSRFFGLYLHIKSCMSTKQSFWWLHFIWWGRKRKFSATAFLKFSCNRDQYLLAYFFFFSGSFLLENKIPFNVVFICMSPIEPLSVCLSDIPRMLIWLCDINLKQSLGPRRWFVMKMWI